MTGNEKPSDSRLNVARYRVDRSAPEPAGETGPTGETRPAGETGPAHETDETDVAGQTRMDQRAQYVEIVVQQAMRRGDFDNLPGAGKPIPNLTQTYDPDWWIRQKIEREQITGLGPPALTLRTENAELDARLDRAASEHAVRQTLADFNARIVEARRQLNGGPPVITPLRDIDDEVARWHQRRDARQYEADRRRTERDEALRAMSWRERRRARRGGTP